MPSLPSGASRPSGQSALMERTFAGQNKCNPKNQDRPFIVEWDATDLSQFESITNGDLVFVRYEGCELRVIDSCRNDSLKGSLGAYKSVDWTSGSVEKMDISNEGDLYAKLPLGAATLGGRVAAGEAFHMEYFVSGVRTATRPVVYGADLAPLAGCKGATHFVYAYQLGAYALGSTKHLKVDANATVWGASAGGSAKQASAAEKRAGVLESCRGESAKETSTCKAPIRLTLREIEQGESPGAKAAVAPETPTALNLAGKVDAKMQRNEKASEHIDAARAKHNARDGKGCLSELDKADKLDPRPAVASTNPASYWSSLRAHCVMLIGQCAPGRQLLRRYMEANLGNQMGPEAIDSVVDSQAATFCQGKDLSPRDQLLQANEALQAGSMTKKDAATCKQSYERVKALAATVTAKGPDDTMVIGAKAAQHELLASQCFARAGDCTNAWAMYSKSIFASEGAKGFKGLAPHCKDFTPPTSGPNADATAVAEQLLAARTAIATKVSKLDKTCLAALDAYDLLVADPAQRSTSPTSLYATSRAGCLMLSSRCDEGERLQRSVLAVRPGGGPPLPAFVVEGNIKSMRKDWCK